MSDYISWLLMPGYMLQLVNMAAALHKPYHKSQNDLIQLSVGFGEFTVTFFTVASLYG